MPDVADIAVPIINPSFPNILLIGDSISIGYTLPVRGLLEGRANVFRPPINCGPTSRGLEQLGDWLGNRDWSIIHFNFGLHDLKYVDVKSQMANPPESGTQNIPIDQYEQKLKRIITRLEQTRAKLIWCSTTPVPENSSGRLKGDADRYNGAASRVVSAHNLDVNDLYTFALARLPSIQRPENVHFTDDGSIALANQVVSILLAHL